MAVIIPEITLCNIVEQLLAAVKIDYEQNIANDTEAQSLIYKYFNGIVNYKNDWYKEAVDLFNRPIDHPRNIEVRMFFDAERAKIPTVHITLPSDQLGQNSLGVGESGYTVDETDGMQSVYYERRFDSTYHVVCTSDNHSETLLMYHLIRAGLISIFDTLSLRGLENAKLSGQEIKLNGDLAPPHIFSRAIGISLSYDISVPRWWSMDIINEICLGQVTIKQD